MKHPSVQKACGVLIAYLLVLAAMAEPIAIDPQYQQRYNSLLNELRCLVCQNQTIAESNAELAVDLRVEVKKMLEQGATDAEIIDFMANRYGDFVLYKPLIKPKTYLLWFGPFVLLALVIFILVVVINRQKNISSKQLSAEEIAKLDSILEKDNDEGKE